MLTTQQRATIADELPEADRAHTAIPRITARHPRAAVEDAYAIQELWRDRMIAAGRNLVGRKIGLTSKAMQQAAGITEPDYGVMFDDTVFASGAQIEVDRFRTEVELAFVLKTPLAGPDCTLAEALAASIRPSPRRTSRPVRPSSSSEPTSPSSPADPKPWPRGGLRGSAAPARHTDAENFM